ncbi:MAG: SpoIIE family protein phosphatase [Clostridia bacterium]
MQKIKSSFIKPPALYSPVPEILKNIFKYLAIFVVFIVLANAKINQSLSPFTYGMYFAFIFSGINPFILAPLYIGALVIFTPTLTILICATFTSVVGIMAYYLNKNCSGKLKLPLFIFYTLLSQSVYVYFNLGETLLIIEAVTTVLLGLLFLLAGIKTTQAITNPRLKYRLTIDEMISGSVIIMALALGFYNLSPLNIELIRVFATFAILFCTYIFGGTVALFIGGIIGLGVAFYSADLTYISVFVVWAMLSSAFKASKPILSSLAIIFIDVVFGLYFNAYLSYTIFSVASNILGCFLFMIIPMATIKKMCNSFNGVQDRFAQRSIVNRNRSTLFKRLHEMSDVFAEMERVFKNMVRGNMPIKEAKAMLANELLGKVCADCPDREKCLRTVNEDTLKVFNELVGIGFEKGKITLIDIPPYLTSRCGKLTNVLSNINQLILQYKQYNNMINNMDSSRILIGEQLCGVSKIMKALAEEINRNIVFDSQKEKMIIEDLTYQDIVCDEALIYEQNAESTNATLLIRTLDIPNKRSEIEKSVSKTCGVKMTISTVETSERTAFSVVNLKTCPKYDVVFGSASCPKYQSSLSGDTHSLIKIGDDRFMFALCDGMGSGQKAERASNLAISLIENFYRAGFDNDIILTSVNKLLSLTSEEVFTALDVCVVDLRKGVADIIKVGSPYGFIKHKENIDIIESGALPLGILEEVKPCIVKTVLMQSDMIVLMTDGITESFSGSEELQNFINNADTLNPQTLADTILERAVQNDKQSPNDDMTVLVARIFPLA